MALRSERERAGEEPIDVVRQGPDFQTVRPG